MTVGEELAKASDGILDLMLKAPDLAEKKALRDQLTKILAETAKLVEANVQKDTAQYRAATEGLVEANAAIQTAQRDLKKVADTINNVAMAIDLVGKLAAAAA
jgi:hypothetical protein